jgi:hypothetical protein
VYSSIRDVGDAAANDVDEQQTLREIEQLTLACGASSSETSDKSLNAEPSTHSQTRANPAHDKGKHEPATSTTASTRPSSAKAVASLSSSVAAASPRSAASRALRSQLPAPKVFVSPAKPVAEKRENVVCRTQVGPGVPGHFYDCGGVLGQKVQVWFTHYFIHTPRHKN